ncbi:hypothetical protein OIV83_003964 [Microbotryomycetes sp. JL201]|nr:hypothetical protein OIV83_003964 [Microbotryomycetes sp. JL201]
MTTHAPVTYEEHAGRHRRLSFHRRDKLDSQPIYVGNQGDHDSSPPLTPIRLGPKDLDPEFDRHERRHSKHRLKRMRAEAKIAMGVRTLLKERKRAARSDGEYGDENARGGGVDLVESLVQTVEEKLTLEVKGNDRTGGTRQALALSMNRVADAYHRDVEPLIKGPVGKVGLAVLGAVAATMAAKGAKGHQHEERRSFSSSSRRSSFSQSPSRVPREIQTQSKQWLSQLNKREHYVIQHAAALLLAKQSELRHMWSGFERVLSVLQSSNAGRDRHEKHSSALFGVSLMTLARYEGVESRHCLGETPVRIPSFIDHCISALKAMDVATEGILRKTGNLKKINEVIHALDNAHGNGTVVDLAALEPVDLASLFKKFLACLPDPVMSGHLFKLWLATTHIKNVALRKRAMHLVICLMPKHRDVLEVVFLFLAWLSEFAHVNVRVGNQMDLTNIAKVMAPTLLRPSHRDPRVTELPAMVAAVLNLLEDQHVLHEIPQELAAVLQIRPAKKDSRGLLHQLESLLL